MDVPERLSPEQAREPSLVALPHAHRYELAASVCAGKRVLHLCCGSGFGSEILARSAASVVGIADDAQTLESARAALAGAPGLSFERADPREVLDRELEADFDAIVLLEGLAQLADPAGVLEQLAAHGRAGVALVVSVPNAGGPGDHGTGYDPAVVMKAVDQLPSPTVLCEFYAEGSLIRPRDGRDLDTTVTSEQGFEPDSCDQFLIIVNAPASATEAHRSQLAVVQVSTSHTLELERVNRELKRANRRLARERLGIADSAAAAALTRPRRSLPPGALRLVGAATRAGNVLKAVILNVLPHGLTVILVEARGRMKDDHRR